MKSNSWSLKCYRRLIIVISLMVYWSFSNTLLAQANVEAGNLQTEYKSNPLGLEVKKPRMFWKVISNDRNVLQTAYQIKASTSRKGLESGINLLWKTKKIKSDQSTHVEYNGPELKSGQRVYWQVRVWDNKGNVSDWSKIASWEMGLMNPSDWKASWIEPDIREDENQVLPQSIAEKRI